IIGQQKVNLTNPELSRVYLRPNVDRHNCGGDASCDQIAAAFLAAIQDWANRTATGGTPPAGQPVVSAMTNFSQTIDSGSARVDDNAIALFTFAEGAGDLTMDTSGVGAPITLQLEGTEWFDGGGLRNVSGKAQASEADSRKLFEMITASAAYSVEAWVISDNTAQDGPARMVSYSQDTAARNFTLGQNAIYYQLRNRTAGTGVNGTPALEALDPQVSTNLQHVVSTYDAVSGRKVYVDGQLSIEENVADDALDWLDNQLLVLGNEVTNDRLWQGVFKLVAIHDKALNGAEVQQNFDAGTGNVVTMRFDVSAVVGQTAYIDFQAAQIDAAGYLFARPVFVSDATGVTIKNIRIGVNGAIPVAAQAFRRVDTIVNATGTELSPLGSVIPVALGVDNDQFHLEFEVLAGQAGTAEPMVPSSPPPPAADVMESERGLRTFAQINDTMSSLTGIDANQNTVLASYTELQGSLPVTADLMSFAAAQQIAIQRLAVSYCGAVVSDGPTCDAFFGACAIDGAAKDQVATVLYDRFIGANLANQPDIADVTTEIVSVIDDLQCAGGCNGATAELALQASCAAVLSSAAVTVN
ncbi:MAG: LamG-like jellyroll fold domain-containing protein, partial [Woeseiaceae bacterium]